MRALAILSLSAIVAGARAAPLDPVPSPAPPGGPVIILARHALDGRGRELHDVRIRVSDGYITSLAGNGAPVIDLRNYTVLPGWIDVHVHLASHFDSNGRIATDTEPPARAMLGIAQAAWDSLMGDGDPLKDLTAVRRVVFVMRGGVVFKWPGAARPGI